MALIDYSSSMSCMQLMQDRSFYQRLFTFQVVFIQFFITIKKRLNLKLVFNFLNVIPSSQDNQCERIRINIRIYVLTHPIERLDLNKAILKPRKYVKLNIFKIDPIPLAAGNLIETDLLYSIVCTNF